MVFSLWPCIVVSIFVFSFTGILFNTVDGEEENLGYTDLNGWWKSGGGVTGSGPGELWRKEPGYITTNIIDGESLFLTNAVDTKNISSKSYLSINATLIKCKGSAMCSLRIYAYYGKDYKMTGRDGDEKLRSVKAKFRFLGNTTYQVNNTTERTIEVNHRGQYIHFGIAAKNAKWIITDMRLFYYYCEKGIINNINLPDVTSPNREYINVTANCSRNTYETNKNGTGVIARCYNNGTWKVTNGNQCRCLKGFESSESDGCLYSCPAEKKGSILASGDLISWPETPAGIRANVSCPYNSEGKGFITRECRYKYSGKLSEILWGPITTVNCTLGNYRSNDIFLLSQKQLDILNVSKTSLEIRNLTQRGNTLLSRDIVNTATVLENIVAVPRKADEVADNILATVDNVLDASLDAILQSQEKSNSSLRIVETLNTLLETLTIGPNGTFQRILKNYVVDLTSVQPRFFSGITFSGVIDSTTSSPLKNESIVKERSGDYNVSAPGSTTIRIPRTIFNETIPSNLVKPQTIILSFYRESKFFSEIKNGSVTTSSEKLNSFVIAGSIKKLSVTNLKIPVELTFTSVKPGDKNSTLCSFFDFAAGNWSQEGCSFQEVLPDGRVVCNCEHLTNFAMLMDIYPSETTSHERILGLVSYIGCGLSLFGLVLTIVTILILRELRSKVPGQILLNFCISLSLTLIVFLCAAERSKTSSLASCRAAAIALHYFVLVVFTWTAIEAFNMYLAFVKVLPSYFSKFILKCCIVGWGLPAVVVSITVGVALDEYGDKKYCRLHGIPFLVAFLSPVLIILLGNSIAFVLIFRSLLASGSKVTSDRRTTGYQQARQGAAIGVVLGLTWLFGVLAINDAKLVFQYLFCIFNSLQGFLVFIFYCVLPNTVRRQYRKYLRKKTKTLKKKDVMPVSHLETERKKGNTEGSNLEMTNTKGDNATLPAGTRKNSLFCETSNQQESRGDENNADDEFLENDPDATKVGQEIVLIFENPGTLNDGMKKESHHVSMTGLTLQNNSFVVTFS